ncbi:Telomere length regulation protein clk-2 [Caenorhabditis elegans]|uniref:Telomere length regulation protein clk-2 n=1 Tax=Caenorhabditis elegans TaxID=6239 RepID=CLK2_CAEEL|nr:Telomere length regulation protein clk-2 [Caenorhabditis elegans]Q95YE9.2 RecName: Full=Telomere length regulation protein clk-2; AltName: Full=Clock abnormal protein 2 [Caenorhabditis elegans]AAL28024.1 CLK-2 [Caenorhabditis elegans]CAC44622.1 putative telomere binding protein [Caenorhabditis elegans]CCD63593.1 Telomere length regulation protein clk-2 [Caenorhabditis elegans]|eukprot:NP_498650.2 Telomere length regulation protein clk-2 [Caenorhabditis elegans]
MNLRSRLVNATERAVLFQIFKDVQNDPEKYDNAVEAICESIDYFGKFLTDSEYLTQIKPILDTQCPTKSIICFSKCLTKVSTDINTTTFRDVITMLDWLKYVVEKSLTSAICSSLKVKETDVSAVQLYREFASACSNIPEKVSNCCAKALSGEHVKYINTVKWIFKMNLVQGIQKAMLLAHDDIVTAAPFTSFYGSGGPYMKTVAEIISSGRNIDITNKDGLLVQMIEWIGSLNNFDSQWRRMMFLIFQEPTYQGIQVHESLLTTLFLISKSDQILKRCIEATDLTGTLKRVVMVKLPFQRVLKRKTIEILINFVYRTKEQFAIQLLETSVKIWSDLNYAKSAPESQERHIVRMILYLVHLFRTCSSIDWESLFLNSMDGVHCRMSMLPMYVQSGIFVNQALCKQATKHRSKTHGSDEQPPETLEENKFVSSEVGKIWFEEMTSILEHGFNSSTVKDSERVRETANEITKDDSGEEFEETNAQRLQNNKDSAAITSKNNLRLDSDDDEDFPDYQVNESEKIFKNLEIGEEPKNKVTPPAYIADAFEMLLEKEKYEVFEAAFFNITNLINRRPIGFPQIAEKLFIRILHLQNNFGTPKFKETVDEIAVACITQRPEIVPSVVRLIIAPGQGFSIKQRLLHYIHNAADGMGALDKKLEECVMAQQLRIGGPTLSIILHRTINTDYDDEDEDPHRLLVPEWRRMVDARIAANTRRIGTTREPPRAGVVNRLAQAAKYMFYPLLVLPRGENASLLGKDSDLLASLIMVASMVYVRCGVCPQIHRMSSELISYATPHRFSENAKLRTACIIAHLNVTTLLPGDLMDELFDVPALIGWFDWANSVLVNASSSQLEKDMTRQFGHSVTKHLQRYHPAVLQHQDV